MTTNAARRRRYRERQALGLSVISVELEVVGLTHLLIAQRLLPANFDELDDAQERRAIANALEKFLAAAIYIATVKASDE